MMVPPHQSNVARLYLPANLQRQTTNLTQPILVQQTAPVPVTGLVSVQNHFGQPVITKMDWQQFRQLINVINAGFERVVRQLS